MRWLMNAIVIIGVACSTAYAQTPTEGWGKTFEIGEPIIFTAAPDGTVDFTWQVIAIKGDKPSFMPVEANTKCVVWVRRGEYAVFHAWKSANSELKSVVHNFTVTDSSSPEPKPDPKPPKPEPKPDTDKFPATDLNLHNKVYKSTATIVSATKKFDAKKIAENMRAVAKKVEEDKITDPAIAAEMLRTLNRLTLTSDLRARWDSWLPMYSEVMATVDGQLTTPSKIAQSLNESAQGLEAVQ